METIRNVLNMCQIRGIEVEHIGACAISPSTNKTKKKWCNVHKWCHHTTEKCRGTQKNKLTSSYNIYSLNKLFSNSIQGKLVTPVVLPTGKIIQALIDTGADVSCINRKVAGMLRLSNQTPVSVFAFNGNSVLGKWTEPATFKIFNQERKLELLSFTEMSHEMILGMDVLKPLIEELGAERIFNPDIRHRKQSVHEISIGEALSKKLTAELKGEFKTLFTEEIKQENLCSMRKHTIDTGNNKPICRDGNRVPIQYQQMVEEEIQSLKSRGIIRPSNSPWRFGMVVAPKQNGKIRICIDYRPLNLITTKSAYPMPRIDEILDSLAKAKVFSVIDATSGYHQIAMEEDDIEKTAFAWKGQLYEYTRMPFGLCNAPATFQATMDAVLQEFKWKCAIPYLDDVIIYSESIEEHQEHLRRTLNKIKSAGLVLNEEKCRFFESEIEYLGHIISEGVIKPDPKRIKTILECKPPITLKDLRSFLGLANFCGQFIPHYATKIAPLTELLKGEKQSSQKEIDWSEEANMAFESIKLEIANITERGQPDLSKEFILTTDASNTALGAVLTQFDGDGNERLLSCYSKKFDKAQSNYSTTDKELVAVMLGIEHYKHYLLGKHFTLKTDHKALEHMQTASNDNSRILRIALKLQNYQFTPIYIKGETNVADFLSRPQERKGIASISINDLSEETRKKIIEQYHIISGHGSANTVKFLLKNRYNWNGITKDIEKQIEHCPTCLKAGEALQNTKNRIITTSRPNELWEIDLLGRIPGENDSNRFIVVAIDHYTKWLEAKVINHKTADEIQKAIEELIIEKHGTPEKILTDQGTEFENSKIQELAKEYGIKWIFASPRHHETVGAVERANQTLMNILKKLSNFGETSWTAKLPKAVWAYNISMHRAINTSPYILKYGKVPELQIDKELNQPEITIPKSETQEKRDRHFQKYAEKSIEKGKKLIKYDLQAGDPVLVFRPHLKDKFKGNWIPGFEIKEKIFPDAYLTTDGTREYRFNKAHVKRNTAL